MLPRRAPAAQVTVVRGISTHFRTDGGRLSSAYTPAVEDVHTELLRGSLRSRCRQAMPALAAMALNTGFTIPLLGRGVHPGPLAAWLLTILSLLVVRALVARRAADQLHGSRSQLEAHDRAFRRVSMASQTVTGAGIWLVLPLRDDEVAAYIMTLLIAFYGVGAMINLAHDYRSLRLSLPILLGQPILFWATHGSGGLVIAVILGGLTALMILSARNSQQTFNDSLRIRFEKDAVLRQLEQEKQIAAEALRNAEAANRAKSFFMASASHDLRQPLYAATILADTLALHPLDPRTAALVSQQREALGAASGLFDNLLDLSKFESGVVEPAIGTVRLADVLRQMSVEFGALADSKRLYLRVARDAPPVESDFDLLSRLVRNLVSNAIRYTTEGGVTIETTHDGEHVLLSVQDTGIGIAPEDQERVFQEFVQLANPQRARDKGTGLGLAIVRHIAALLSHPIHVESAPGRGTRITVRLPAASDAGAAAPAAAPDRATALEGRRVWIVEDDPLVRDALLGYFQQRGSAVRTALTRAELLELERQDGLPDFVILDDMLGGAESGLVLALWLASRMPRNCILITTGNPEEARWVALSASGITALRKPVSTAALNDWLGAGRAG
jgi:signal transduction histidine kinase